MPDREIPIEDVIVGTRVVAFDSGLAHRIEDIDDLGDGYHRIKPAGLAWSPACKRGSLVMVREP